MKMYPCVFFKENCRFRYIVTIKNHGRVILTRLKLKLLSNPNPKNPCKMFKAFFVFLRCMVRIYAARLYSVYVFNLEISSRDASCYDVML